MLLSISLFLLGLLVVAMPPASYFVYRMKPGSQDFRVWEWRSGVAIKLATTIWITAVAFFLFHLLMLYLTNDPTP